VNQSICCKERSKMNAKTRCWCHEALFKPERR
jgi:hypothetical protein